MLAGLAAVWAASRGIGSVALGSLAGNPFPDATEAFLYRLRAAAERVDRAQRADRGAAKGRHQGAGDRAVPGPRARAHALLHGPARGGALRCVQQVQRARRGVRCRPGRATPRRRPRGPGAGGERRRRCGRGRRRGGRARSAGGGAGAAASAGARRARGGPGPGGAAQDAGALGAGAVRVHRGGGPGRARAPSALCSSSTRTTTRWARTTW